MNHLNIKLSGEALSAVQFVPNSDNAPRAFSGIAHSGLPFVHFGTRYIVDLSNIQPTNANIGVLIEHNPNQRAGSGVLSVQNNQLHISGSLLNNEHGKAIAADADGQFPFEMSAYIQAARWEELTDGATAIVNGQTVSGNIVIMRDCIVREVSFVAVGVDKHTSAVVLSDGSEFTPNFNQSTKETSMTKEEQAQFDEMKTKLAALEEENATLKAEKAKAQKKANVDTKLSAAGFVMNEDGKFKGVSDNTYALLLSAQDDALDGVIGDLKLGLVQQNKPKLPESLTTDTHAAHETDGMQLSAAAAQSARSTLGGYPVV